MCALYHCIVGILAFVFFVAALYRRCIDLLFWLTTLYRRCIAVYVIYSTVSSVYSCFCCLQHCIVGVLVFLLTALYHRCIGVFVDYSTVSSGLNSLAAVVLQDMVKAFCFPNMKESTATNLSKGLGTSMTLLTLLSVVSTNAKLFFTLGIHECL